jgi:hypothetical protein
VAVLAAKIPTHMHSKAKRRQLAVITLVATLRRLKAQHTLWANRRRMQARVCTAVRGAEPHLPLAQKFRYITSRPFKLNRLLDGLI